MREELDGMVELPPLLVDSTEVEKGVSEAGAQPHHCLKVVLGLIQKLWRGGRGGKAERNRFGLGEPERAEGTYGSCCRVADFGSLNV